MESKLAPTTIDAFVAGGNHEQISLSGQVAIIKACSLIQQSYAETGWNLPDRREAIVNIFADLQNAKGLGDCIGNLHSDGHCPKDQSTGCAHEIICGDSSALNHEVSAEEIRWNAALDRPYILSLLANKFSSDIKPPLDPIFIGQGRYFVARTDAGIAIH